MNDTQLIRNDIAFWAILTMAQVHLLGGSRIGACMWLAIAGFMVWRARRARRIAEGRPSFWEKVWTLR